MKRIKSAALALGCVCFLFVGCGRIDAGMYDKLQAAVEETLAQSGGELMLQSSASGQDDIMLRFTYRYDEDDVMQYCVEQTDKTGRRLFLEHNDGKVLQRWLLGHGSTSFDETSSDFVRYTRKNPYKYLAMLSVLPQPRMLSELSMTEEENGKMYTLTLLADKVSGEKDANETLTARVICCTVGENGLLSAYREESTYIGEDSKESKYTLCMTFSRLGEVEEVKFPSEES